MASNKQAIATLELPTFTDHSVKEIITLHPWMNDVKFTLLTRPIDVSQYIDRCVQQGRCAFDLETTGLNTRLTREGKPWDTISGIGIATSPTDGAYIPISHEYYANNIPISFMVKEMQRLVHTKTKLIFHNFKFDAQMLINYGIVLNDWEMFDDTYLMAAIWDASRKQKGLKGLAEQLLQRKMIELKELGLTGKGQEQSIHLVPPQKALYYVASDVMCTYGLFEYFTKAIDEQDPKKTSGPWNVYNMEKRCLPVTMEMERNMVRIDKAYLENAHKEVVIRMKNTMEAIYKYAGREVDISSPKQLGVLLFEELKIPHPFKGKDGKDKTKSGQWATDVDTMEALGGKHPIADAILKHRSLEKIKGTYIENFLKNADWNNEVKFQLNQVAADTGRYSSSGGSGLEGDGYAGVNCQNIPKPDEKDPESIDLRGVIVARPGYKIVTIDYSGEELRIAANFSREPKWINEFVSGDGDLHSVTAKIIYKIPDGEDIAKKYKKERGVAKSLNFLTLYGGGAGTFAANAKVAFDDAKKMIENFFKGLPTLKKWIDSEIKASRKRGYSRTAFGRRRPLREYYENPDKKIQNKGDRCAVNASIQGCLQPHERCLTTEGYLTVEEIISWKGTCKPIKVWTGTSWETFDVLPRGEAQYAKLTLENGLYLDCDVRHQVLTFDDTGYKFVHFDDLVEGDSVCVSLPREHEFGSYPEPYVYVPGAGNGFKLNICLESDWDFIAYLMGYLIGDGNLRINESINKRNFTICFGRKKRDRHYQYLKKGLEKLGVTIGFPSLSKTSKGESYRSSVDSKGLVLLLEKLGMKQADSRHKLIPEFMYKAPLSMRKAFFIGYHNTDGCKDTANAFGFHTPNRELLAGLQRLAWTIGLSSKIFKTVQGTHKLVFQDKIAVAKLIGFDTGVRKRYFVLGMDLPQFIRQGITTSLRGTACGKDNNDKALLCKINKNKSIAVPTVNALLEKYGCDKPLMYYHYRLKKKEVLDTKGRTYTLSVHSPLHRFDAGGIISKNSGADVIKIALYRVWKWIQDNDYRTDCRILMPVHDEIIFEVKEEKMDFFIPELTKIMMLSDIIQKLQWPVPLTVDAEYGDSYHVDHNYFEELREQEKAGAHVPKPAENTTTTTSKGGPEEVGSAQGGEASLGVLIKGNSSGELSAEQLKALFDENGVKEQVAVPVITDAKIKDKIDKQGFLNYPVKVDRTTATQLRCILDILKNDNSMFVGPKVKLRLLSGDGEVWCTVSEGVSLDAFLMMCLWLNI